MHGRWREGGRNGGREKGREDERGSRERWKKEEGGREAGLRKKDGGRGEEGESKRGGWEGGSLSTDLPQVPQVSPQDSSGSSTAAPPQAFWHLRPGLLHTLDPTPGPAQGEGSAQAGSCRTSGLRVVGGQDGHRWATREDSSWGQRRICQGMGLCNSDCI